jgi:hypothetical protein
VGVGVVEGVGVGVDEGVGVGVDGSCILFTPTVGSVDTGAPFIITVELKAKAKIAMSSNVMLSVRITLFPPVIWVRFLQFIINLQTLGFLF